MSNRKNWRMLEDKVISRVINALSEGSVKDLWKDYKFNNVAELELIVRIGMGIIPRMGKMEDLSSEERQTVEMYEVILEKYLSETDFSSWNLEICRRQPLVEAGFLCCSLMRGGVDKIWKNFSDNARCGLLALLRSVRSLSPFYNNWLVFSAVIEVFLKRIGEDYDFVKVELIMRQLSDWYIGDGYFKDGKIFSMNYYNSVVIYPLVLDLLIAMENDQRAKAVIDIFVKAAQRKIELLERMIGPDGCIPAIGRSLTYRTGLLHLLYYAVYRDIIPNSLKLGAVRSALYAVLSRFFYTDVNFNNRGFLHIGFMGKQSELAESYISPGSLYIACVAFLPLALAYDADFWLEEDLPWTSVQMYSGINIKNDEMRCPPPLF